MIGKNKAERDATSFSYEVKDHEYVFIHTVFWLNGMVLSIHHISNYIMVRL